MHACGGIAAGAAVFFVLRAAAPKSCGRRRGVWCAEAHPTRFHARPLSHDPGPDQQLSCGQLPGPLPMRASRRARGVWQKPVGGKSGRVCLGWRTIAPAGGRQARPDLTRVKSRKTTNGAVDNLGMRRNMLHIPLDGPPGALRGTCLLREQYRVNHRLPRLQSCHFGPDIGQFVCGGKGVHVASVLRLFPCTLPRHHYQTVKASA
jgi:hypothetical protein